MIQLNGVCKAFSGQVLFENLTWMITPRDRVGLIGENGSGKTTLLRMLNGEIPPDKGSVDIARGATIGYLPQDGCCASGRPLLEEVISVFEDLLEMEQEQHRLADLLKELIPNSPEAAAAMERYGELQTAFQLRGGFALESQAAQVLAGLGFSREDFSKPVETFSGGWQMRIALAKLLLKRPNLLLLDEPTNHLDLEARNWLESYLQDYPHACIIVSHDRFFLDASVERVADLFGRKLTLYFGGYTRYLAQREANIEALRESYRRQQEHIEKLQTFINKFRYKATKAKQVQSRIKELEKIDRIDLPEMRSSIHFRFPQPERSGRRVMELEGVRKSYGALTVFRKIDFLIEQGEKVALVGPNGAGKSTLLRILAGTEVMDAGRRIVGHNVRLDYFAQDQDKVLDNHKTVLDTLMSAAPMDVVPQLRTLLGCFLFQGDEVFKKVAVLSGGERNRLALARLLLQPANCLLLDEPTNHLDMNAKEVLLEALQNYAGTAVFVSHDRYFIDSLATRIIEVGGEEIVSYPGNYEDYLWKKQQENPSAVNGLRVVDELRSQSRKRETAPGPPLLPANAGPKAPSVQAPKNSQAARVNPQKVQALAHRIEVAEAEIEKLESQIVDMEKRMANAEFFKTPANAQESLAAWEKLQEVLREKMAEWEALCLERDRMMDRS